MRNLHCWVRMELTRNCSNCPVRPVRLNSLMAQESQWPTCSLDQDWGSLGTCSLSESLPHVAYVSFSDSFIFLLVLGVNGGTCWREECLVTKIVLFHQTCSDTLSSGKLTDISNHSFSLQHVYRQNKHWRSFWTYSNHIVRDQLSTTVPEKDLCQKSRCRSSLNEISAESWVQTYHLFLAETRYFYLSLTASAAPQIRFWWRVESREEQIAKISYWTLQLKFTGYLVANEWHNKITSMPFTVGFHLHHEVDARLIDTFCRNKVDTSDNFNKIKITRHHCTHLEMCSQQ